MKRKLLRTVLLLILVSETVYAQYISRSEPLPYNCPVVVCAGTFLRIKFDYQNFTAGNEIQAYLSDASGSFASPTVVSASLYGLNSSSQSTFVNGPMLVSGSQSSAWMEFKVPATLPPGSGYKIQMHGTTPNYTNTNDLFNCTGGTFSVTTPPTAPVLPAGQNTFGVNEWVAHTYSWTPTGPLITLANYTNENFFTSYMGYFTHTSLDFDLNYGNPSTFPGVQGTDYQVTNLCPRAVNYGIRFKRRENLPPGMYTFTIGADDGARLSVDGGATWLVSDMMEKTYSTDVSASVCLSGSTDLVMEYFQRPFASRVSLAHTFVPSTTTITTQPADVNQCSANASFTVAVSTSSTVTYQWELSTDGGATYSSISNAGVFSGATTTTLVLTGATTAMNSNKYRLKVIGGSCGSNATSNSASLTITPSNTITSQAQNAAVCPGQNASFTIAVSGTGATFQWQQSSDGGVTFNNISNAAPFSGTNSASMTVAAVTAALNNTMYRAIVNPGSPCPVTSNPANLTLNPAPVVNATNATICSGALTNVPINSSVAATYSWTATVAGSTISGSSSGTGSPIAQTLTNTGTNQGTVTYSITANAGGGCSGTGSVTVTVNAPLTPGAVGISQTVCNGSAVQGFTEILAATGGTGAYTYTWDASPDQAIWTPITGQTNATYNPGAVASTTYYRRNVTSGSCGTLSSPVVSITIGSTVNPGTVGAPQTICYNSAPAKFTETAAASGGGGAASYVYNWQSSPDNSTWTDIPGATNGAAYQAGAVTSNTYFRRKLTPGTCPPVYSNSVLVTVSSTTPGSIGNPQTICYNTAPATLTEILAPSGVPTPAYQWESSTDNLNFTSIAGATTKTYTSPVLTQTTYFRRNITGTACNPLSSVSIAITVSPDLDPGTVAGPQTICSGQNPAILKESSPASGGGPGAYTYSWESSGDTISWAVISGASSNTYAPPAITNTTYYKRRVTSGSCGNKPGPAVLITVLAPVTPGTIGSAQTVCYNYVPSALTELTRAGGGTGTYNYLWQYSTDNAIWSDISGATSQSLYQPGNLLVSTYFRRKVSSGTCQDAYTPAVLVQVSSISPGAIDAPQGICSNTAPALLTEKVPPSGVLPPYNFQWQSSSDNNLFTDIAGATASTYAPPALTTKTYYRRNLLGTSCGPLSSTSIAITINSASNPSVSLSPSSSVCQGTPFTYTATAANAGTPTYTWTINGAAAGTNSNTLTSSGFANGDVVKVVVSSSLPCSPAPASAQTVTIIQSPVAPAVSISDPGLNCTNNLRTFTPSPVNGGATPSYLWNVNGMPVFSGSPFSSSTLLNGDKVNVTMTSSLTCVSSPTAASGPVTVQINSNPKVQITPPFKTVCDGDQVIFEATSIAGATYAWALNGITVGTSPKLSTTTGGTYIVTVKNACTDTSKSTLVVMPQIKLKAGPPALICKGASANLTAFANGVNNYTWSNEASGASIVVSPAVTTLYTVRASNGFCNASDTVRVTLRNSSPATVYIPNAFSPNGDRLNDTFQVRGEGIAEMEGLIYNRWGELIFRWIEIDGGWEGPVKQGGDLTLNDVFVYSVKVKNICEANFSKPLSGIVTIVK